MNLMRCLYYVCLASFTSSQQPTLSIMPELTHLWLLEGSELNLDCIYTRPDTATRQSFSFYFNAQIIPETNNMGYTIFTMRQENPSTNMETNTLTLKKNTTRMVDGREYLCKTNNGMEESRINVHIFKVTLVGDTLTDGATSLNLQCKPKGLNPNDNVEISWSRNSKSITTDSKYKVHDGNSILEILTPERADMGEYNCEVVFSPGTKEEHRVRPQPLIVKASPAIDSHSNGKNMVKGEQLDLWCKVSGNPFPAVEWFKDDNAINTSTRIYILEYEGSPTGKLTIFNLEFEDKGDYACKASSPEFIATFTADMVIGVGVLAPPAIDSHSNGKNMIQGEQLDLWCKVSGYPLPIVEWFKDDNAININDRIDFLEYEGSPTGKLIIFHLEFEDKGDYSCKASSPEFNATVTANMVIGVRGQYIHG